MKRLALFLDGTWNKVSSHTNVSQLSALATNGVADGVTQKTQYYEGVGTRKGEWLRGGALGYGLDDDVRTAYRWLLDHYEDGDELFIFGFSRGAFTARSLCGLLSVCGLLRRGVTMSIDDVFDWYRAYGRRPDGAMDTVPRAWWRLDFVAKGNGALTDEERRRYDQSRRIRIKMLGVWDTVGSLGVPFGDLPLIGRNNFLFHNTRPTKIMEHGLHALAIDEHRAAFAPTLWEAFVPDRPNSPAAGPVLPDPLIEQRWFPGAHANVGGGGKNADMAKAPLAWMMGAAQRLGLHFSLPAIVPPGSAFGPVDDSFADFGFGIYRWLKLNQRFFRTIGRGYERHTGGQTRPINETIDASVFDRWRALDEWRPPGLANWARSLGLDPATLRGDVTALTGQPWHP